MGDHPTWEDPSTWDDSFIAIIGELWGADDAANDATQALATALGVAELIDRFRFRDPAAPVPAPGAADAPDEVRAATLEALHAATTTRLLYETMALRALDPLLVAFDFPQISGRGPIVPLDNDQDITDAAALRSARAATEAARDRARRTLRHLAQVGLGVAQHAYEDDDTELLERTCIGVLVDGSTAIGEPSGDPVGDDHAWRGRTRAEVEVELAGILARFLATTGGPRLGIDIRTPGGPVRHVGWSDDGGLQVDGLGTFDAPVTITQVVTALLDLCAEADGAAPTDLTVSWAAEAT